MAALYQASFTKVDKKSRSTTLLLNNRRVVNYGQNSSGVCVSYYNPGGGRRQRPIEMIATVSKNAYTTLLQEAAVNETIEISVEKVNTFRTLWGQGNWRTPEFTRQRINLDNWVWAEAYADDTTKTVITLDNGDFGFIKLLVPYTISDLDSTGSGSGSLAIA